MGEIHVHEFITLDGIVEAPSWTMEYPFDPKMGEARACGPLGIQPRWFGPRPRIQTRPAPPETAHQFPTRD